RAPNDEPWSVCSRRYAVSLGFEGKVDGLVELEPCPFACQQTVRLLPERRPRGCGCPVSEVRLERLRPETRPPAPFLRCSEQAGRRRGVSARSGDGCEALNRVLRARQGVLDPDREALVEQRGRLVEASLCKSAETEVTQGCLHQYGLRGLTSERERLFERTLGLLEVALIERDVRQV